MFGKDLVVVVNFDGNKMIDDVEFCWIPIWVRIMKMPLGMMNKTAGETIGDMISDVMEVDADDRELAIGQFLRVMVRLDIQKPLMRCVMTLDLGEAAKEKKKWCPLVYEFLPDFCYTCGFIGHTDKSCDTQLRGEVQQFSKALGFIPEKKRLGDDSWVKPYEARSQLPLRTPGGEELEVWVVVIVEVERAMIALVGGRMGVRWCCRRSKKSLALSRNQRRLCCGGFQGRICCPF